MDQALAQLSPCLASERAIDAVLRDLGRRLRSARDAAGLTQEDAAARAGIDYKRLQRVEAGLVNVTMQTIVRIASALDVTFWQLVASEPERRKRGRRSS